MKIRIKFAKEGFMKFIGHLDVMRYFQKAMRRADVDIVYTEGFSPHQKMSFAAPLGVGLESCGEYFDIEVHSTKSTAKMLGALNQVMVEGISVLNYVELPEDSENAMSMVAAADYEICFGKETFFTEEIQSLYHQFIDADSIEILKKTKKSEKVVDIKPLILESKIVKCQKSEDTVPGIFMKLTTGSVNNLKPELVIEAFLQFLAEQGIVDINSSQVDITGLLYVKRLEIYGFNQEQLQSLDSFGKEIL